MARLVVLSNRVADLNQQTQTGGLAVGLADAIKSRGGLWFGWNGSIEAEPSDTPDVSGTETVKMASLSLSDREYKQYYTCFSNSFLWPLLHYRADLLRYHEICFSCYRKVNARFAASAADLLRSDDLVWVHDYHLIPLGRELRERSCRQRIGFFLHTPFPPPDLFAVAPDGEWLARSMLAYDVVGFQTRADAEHFIHYVTDLDDIDATSDGVRHAGRDIKVGAFPIGIDVDAVADMSRQTADDELVEHVKPDVPEMKTIIGVDRLDYSKGLPDRMKAFQTLLETEPALRGAVTYLQIAPPSREDVPAYVDIREELERVAGSINGDWGEFNWTPIRYIHRNIPRETVAFLFRQSDVGFVAPLRDGMNLVAKEFVVAQNPDDPGVLVLSKFAGAAEDLVDAVIVNPFDPEATARSLRDALFMPLDERQDRHAALLARVRKRDNHAWLSAFLDALSGPASADATGPPPG
ncbi:trehalose-6-phosphate synthase [Fodinicurvata sp. EGI_FJ10296]|uniref:alpha,alpha-trehalose-phosphate synthase (UDP-forming) n=1 Tax=Fodinicurvata sp. EGI_FJ10296 TaxID=3231908 RepID=UPI003454CA43